MVMIRLVFFVFMLILVSQGCGPSPPQPVSQTLPAIDDGVDPEANVRELGISLPAPAPPVANYVKAVRTGNLLFLSGHGPAWPEGTNITGKVGEELSIEDGQLAARMTGISILATLKAELGNLNRVRRIVKVLGMVNSAPDFEEHPQVINGFSNLMVEVFGDRGRHARSAVGMGSLPFDIPVEIEVVVEVD